MAQTLESPLISTRDLAQLIGAPDLRIIDASWWMDGRDARADHARERLPGSVFLDLDAVSDRSSPYPHMLPTPEAFAEAVGQLGIADTDDIVVYDSQGLFSAARVWWTFAIMGAGRVRVLDGGLLRWKAEGHPVETGAVQPPLPAKFHARLDAGRVVTLEQVCQALEQDITVLDARGAPRFRGEVPEPRPGLRCGHMPGATNLPFGELLNADGTFKRGAALQAAFAAAGHEPGQPVITSCGSGVTAAILTLGLAELGHESRLYDGSWAEWGSRSDTPVTTG